LLSAKAGWSLKTVAAVHVLRLLAGIVIVRFLYPLLFTATPNLIEITDRVIIVLLVFTAVHKYQPDFKQLGLSFDHGARNIAAGIGAGILLLFVSIYSERLYTTLLFLTPSQHPLAAQAENAASWQQLFMPLFLAGLAAPIAEEALYRLFTFLPLKERWGLWRGAFGSAVIFAVMHFNAYWLAEMMIGGMGLALLYYWTGSLVSSIVAHSLINIVKVLMLFWGMAIM
jgi:membrane protease YdiL (CAAX protease family)